MLKELNLLYFKDVGLKGLEGISIMSIIYIAVKCYKYSQRKMIKHFKDFTADSTNVLLSESKTKS